MKRSKKMATYREQNTMRFVYNPVNIERRSRFEGILHIALQVC